MEMGTDPSEHNKSELKFYLNDRGYGFITNPDGGKDIFFHWTAIKKGEANQPIDNGTPVGYELDANSPANKPRAAAVWIN